MGKYKDFIARCFKEERTPSEIEGEKMGSGLDMTDFSDPQAQQLMRLRQAAQKVKGMILKPQQEL